MLINPFVIWRGPGTRTAIHRVVSSTTRFEMTAELTRIGRRMRPYWYTRRNDAQRTSSFSWVRGWGR